MNIYLIYAVALSLFSGFIANLLCVLTPNPTSKSLVWGLASINLSSTYWLLKYEFNIASFLLIVMVAFLSFNLYRFGSLRTTTVKIRSSIWLNSGILFLVMALIFTFEIKVIEYLYFGQLLNGAVIFGLICSVIALINTLREATASMLFKRSELSIDNQPTVTVAIAARNEDRVLEETINAVLASTYRKMEVVVLDDCSVDNTGNLMKFYARHGVRFIAGKEPPLGWLGQNWAYEQLFRQASGEFIIYIGADTIIHEDTIHRLVQLAKYKKLKMISLQPKQMYQSILTQLLHPLSILWQTTFRNFIRRAPVSTDIWMISRSTLRVGGGFAQLANVVYPERDLAAETQREKAYYYAFASKNDGAVMNKRLTSIWKVSLRSYYPRSGRNPAIICMTMIAVLAITFAPLFSILDALGARQLNIFSLLSIASIVIWNIAHIILVVRVNPKSWFVALFNLPLAFAVEMALLIGSAYKYEFGTVDWRGRNICWVDQEKALKLNAWRRMQHNLRRG